MNLMEGKIMFRLNKTDSSKLMIDYGIEIAVIIDYSLWLSEKYAMLGLFYFKL